MNDRSFFVVKDVINIDQYIPDLPLDETLVIHIDIWDVKTKYKSIKWSAFRVSFIDYNEKNIVIVGMNRIRTDASRYEMVYTHIYKLTRYNSKTIIDDRPFYGEPWRLWYIYGFLFHVWIMGENSFPMQGAWDRWFLRETEDCQISPENIRHHITHTYSDVSLLKTTFDVRDPEPHELEKYNEVKKAAFEKYNSPRQIISFMLKNLNLDISYESYLSGQDIILPDFGISQFMIEENERRMSIYNSIIDYGRKNFKR